MPTRISLNRLKKTKRGRLWFASLKRNARIIGGGWYWRPNRAGYTDQTASAGVYTTQDAADACWHCGSEKRIVFEILPSGEGVTTQEPKGPAVLFLHTRD